MTSSPRKNARPEKRPKLRQRRPWKLVLQEKRPNVRPALLENRQKRKNVSDKKEKRLEEERRKNWKP